MDYSILNIDIDHLILKCPPGVLLLLALILLLLACCCCGVFSPGGEKSLYVILLFVMLIMRVTSAGTWPVMWAFLWLAIVSLLMKYLAQVKSHEKMFQRKFFRLLFRSWLPLLWGGKHGKNEQRNHRQVLRNFPIAICVRKHHQVMMWANTATMSVEQRNHQ